MKKFSFFSVNSVLLLALTAVAMSFISCNFDDINVGGVGIGGIDVGGGNQGGNGVTATCTAQGVERRICSLDSSHTETQTTAALGHDWGQWTRYYPYDAGIPEISYWIRTCTRDSSHTETRVEDMNNPPGGGSPGIQ